MIDWCAILIFYSSLILQRSIWINLLCNFIVWAHISNNYISLRVYHYVMKYGSEKKKKKKMQSICESASQQRKRPYRVDVKSNTDLYKNFFLLRFRIAQIGHCHKTNIFKYYIDLLNYCVLLKSNCIRQWGWSILKLVIISLQTDFQYPIG